MAEQIRRTETDRRTTRSGYTALGFRRTTASTRYSSGSKQYIVYGRRRLPTVKAWTTRREKEQEECVPRLGRAKAIDTVFLAVNGWRVVVESICGPGQGDQYEAKPLYCAGPWRRQLHSKPTARTASTFALGPFPGTLSCQAKSGWKKVRGAVHSSPAREGYGWMGRVPQ